jgi:hypothetical protein
MNAFGENFADNILPGSIVTYFNDESNDPPHPNTGYNQIGIFLDQKTFLICIKRKVKKLNINHLKELESEK